MRVLIFQPTSGIDQFAGVPAALAARGVSWERFTAGPVPDLALRDASALLLSDVVAPTSVNAIRRARRHGVPVVLLMDGILEWRNTWANPRTGPRFLQPAPVDMIACGGEYDRRILEHWGNRVEITGLPRLAPLRDTPPPPGDHPFRLLVATARTPYFDDADRAHLLEALVALRDTAARRDDVEIAWRLTGDLAWTLDVQVDRTPLADAMADAHGLLTAPSTLLLEAMLAGRRAALIDHHAAPLWPVAAWIWRCVDKDTGDDPLADATTLARDAATRITRDVDVTFAADDLDRLLDTLITPTPERLAVQARAMHVMAETTDAADAVADLVIATARDRARGPHVDLPEVGRLPETLPRVPGRTRVVSCVVVEGSPVGGVTTWSQRLAAELTRNDRGVDLHTLFIATHPPSVWDAGLSVDPSAREHLCVVDHGADAVRVLRHVADAMRRLEPDIVLPNYGDLAWAAAMQLRGQGLRTIAVAHTDDDYYRSLLAHYDRWDGAVAVSRACEAWLESLAGDRPLARIVYGVPVGGEPRAVAPAGPLRLAYVGRMVEHQKRISDLLDLVARLEQLGTDYELHLVGDGADLPAWRQTLHERFGPASRVHLHGRQTAAWVQAFLPTVDVAVLVSEAEGTSVTMLEAMGCGVVPCVTAVSSGVDDWIIDGENGIIVPVGDTAAMATRLHVLAEDRGTLRRMGRLAWEAVRTRIGIAAMADAYAALFQRVLDRTRDAAPSDHGLRLHDEWRWPAHTADDPDACDDTVRDLLRAAGYQRIADDRPGPGADAVVVRAGLDVPPQREIDQWRERGLAVVVSPRLQLSDTVVRAAAALRDAQMRGRARIALYGLGRHTMRLVPLLERGTPIVGFIDDAAAPGQSFFGRPVVTLEETMATLAPDAVLLSSDAHEATMWDRTESLRAAGVEVIRLYEPA